MELTILLSKVFGIYLVVGGLAYMLRRRYFMSMIHDFVEHQGLRVIVAVAELVAGLFLIFTHNFWATFPEGLVSFFGWVLALEGAFYLFTPDKMVRKIIRFFNKKTWFIVGGLVSVIAGLYLIDFGFDLGFF